MRTIRPIARCRDHAAGGRSRTRPPSWVGGVVFGAVILAALDIDRSAHAYLDPGTGSIILQLLLGGIAGVAMVAKLYWHKFRSVFRRKGDAQDVQNPAD